jgi:cysteine desulfurase
MFGGGQEKGLRPGTLPVHLAAGLGQAAEQAFLHHKKREQACVNFGKTLRTHLAPLHPVWVGDDECRLYNTASLRFPGVDSEAVMVRLKGLVALSNGSACTSNSYTPSHVMIAMGLNEQEAQEVVRFSWCYVSAEPHWNEVQRVLSSLLSPSSL